jgi:hypothetical protein
MVEETFRSRPVRQWFPEDRRGFLGRLESPPGENFLPIKAIFLKHFLAMPAQPPAAESWRIFDYPPAPYKLRGKAADALPLVGGPPVASRQAAPWPSYAVLPERRIEGFSVGWVAWILVRKTSPIAAPHAKLQVCSTTSSPTSPLATTMATRWAHERQTPARTRRQRRHSQRGGGKGDGDRASIS